MKAASLLNGLNSVSRMMRKPEVINTHSHKYYTIRPKIL
jgi:hypothetical protein